MPKGLWSAVKKLVSDKRRHRLWLRIVSAMMAVVVFCTTYALILPAVTMERKTYCGLEEHEHTDECYEVRKVNKKTLVCKPEDEADFVIHTHNDFCFDDAGNLICELPELEEHTHTDECYAGAELTCEKEETEGHTHSEECYERTQGDLICTDEDAEHEHTDECYEWSEELICGQDEVEAHTHNEDCYSGEAELVCDIPEVTPHKHDSSCYENGVVACGKPEVIEHEHTAECVQEDDTATEERVLICGKVEHKHTEECYDENYDATTSGSAIAADKLTSATALENGDEPKQLTFAYSDGEVSGVISIPWNDKLPDDLACTVVKLDGENEENLLDMETSLRNAVSDEDKTIGDMQLYRLEWTSNGQSYTLPATIIPKIRMTALDADEDATVIGAVITNDDDKEAAVFKEISGIDSLSETTELLEISNVMLSLYSVEDDTTSEQALEADVSSSTAPAKARAAATTDEEADDETNKDVGILPTETDYTAETITANSNNSVELELASTSTFALLKAYSTTEVSGDYYKRIDSVSDIKSNKSYIIVFQEGVQAFTYTSSTGFAAKKLEIRPVKGVENQGYFTFVDVENRDTVVNPDTMPECNWSIKYGTPGSASTAGYYFCIGSAYYCPYDDYDYARPTWELKYDSDSQTMYAKQSRYYTSSSGSTSYTTCYMLYDEDKKKLGVTSNSSTGEINILIYEYVGGSRDIVDDVAEAEEVEGAGSENCEKPDYAAYTPVSGVQSKTATLGDTVDCTSDASTSQIESELGMAKSNLSAEEQLEEQKKNDGRLITDKSVVYGKDDYSAIGASNYDAGDFSVTLSAVGQEWKIEDSQTEQVPVDVVFILDLSGSMRSSVNSSTEDQRWQASADAINDAMAKILAQNSENRVGLVEFSNTSAPVLELDRYSATDDKFLDYDSPHDVYEDKYSSTYGWYTTCTYTAAKYLRVGSSVRYENSSSAPTNNGKYLYNLTDGILSATYTQRGLQEAYEMFARNDDTTYTLQNGTQVNRQPVIVMVTDGDPTFCTFNYMDPKSGPNYGVGATYGIEGYYTVLSANYFKNLTSIHYGKQANFYTIGEGIIASGYGNDYNNFRGYEDSYRRAVLNPTEDNIKALDSYAYYALNQGLDSYYQKAERIYWEDTSVMLKKLLTEKDIDGNAVDNGLITDNVNDLLGWSSSAYDYVKSDASDYCDGLGWTSSNIRGIANPYKDDYNYVDGAYFGNLTEDDMETIFDEILKDVTSTNRYDFLLKSGTDVTITDPLGDGMTVKGDPVLRFYGQNYTYTNKYSGNISSTMSYVSYYWAKTVSRQTSDAKEDESTVNLSGVIFTIVTNKTTGAQTVTFTIPENALPTFYPDLHHKFYYEELPIRVVYRVGLSLDEEAKLNTAAGGADGAIKDKVYNTNKYSGDTPGTTVTFYPEDGNPYYESDDHQSETIAKVENASGTTADSFIETVNSDGSVTQLLGNNGKLVLNRAESMNITVKKVWESTPANKVSVQLCYSGTRTYTPTGQSIPFTTVDSTVELNAANNWQYTWTGLPKEETSGDWVTNYTNFYVREVPMEGYSATYQDKDGNDLQSQEFTYTTTSATANASNELNAYAVGDVTTTTTDNTIDVVSANSGEVTIVNSKTYTLPESGGLGTRWFTLSGMTILIATSFLYIQNKRKQKQNSRGGEA
jgi:Mg-chelatase subunit ChlD